MVRSSGAAVVLALLMAASTQQAHAAFTCTVAGVTCDALGDLYSATNGAGWKTNIGWSDAAGDGPSGYPVPTDFCTFSGVTCTSGFPPRAVTSLCAHACKRWLIHGSALRRCA